MDSAIPLLNNRALKEKYQWLAGLLIKLFIARKTTRGGRLKLVHSESGLKLFEAVCRTLPLALDNSNENKL